MEIEILKKFEGRKVRLILKNNFIYNSVRFYVTQDNLIEFEDRFGEVVTVEPSYISAITKLRGDVKKWNFS